MNSDRVFAATVPIIRPWVRRIGAKRRAKFAALPDPDGRVVFLGDSITELGWWEEFFPELPTANRGVGGETTGDVLERLDTAITGPSAVSLLIGTNDLHGPRSGRDVDGIAMRTRTIVRRIRERAPEAVLLLNSVLPRTPLWAPRIRRLNELYRSIAAEEGATYVDLWPAYADADGGLKNEYTADNLHLTVAGYAPWVEILRPLLSEIGERRENTAGGE